ncbi:SRPBCC family protein [Corallococcus sp. M7]
MTTQVTSSPKALITQTSEREVRIERIFNASRERVWKALTDPTLVARWWGRGNKLVIERMDVRRGGHWRFIEHAEDGTYGFEGRFRELKPPELIEQTFEWDGEPGHVSVDRTTLEDLGDGRTKLVSVSLFHTVEDLKGMVQAGMEQGINQSYAALDKLLVLPH